MGQVIFCATDYYLKGGYRSYVDFFNMVTWAGYPIIPVSEIDPQSDNVYIFTPSNGETVNGWPNAKATIILWQLEWMLTSEHNVPSGVSRVWSSDRWQADMFNFEYVPMGSDRKLNERWELATTEKVFDVSFLSYQTPRRQTITDRMRDEGLAIAPTQGLMGGYRSMVLLQSRCMVHVHQHDDVPGVAPLRWALAAAHHLPIISEMVKERGIYGYTSMMATEYKYLHSFTAKMIADPMLLRDYADALHGLLCDQLTFKKVVQSHV